MKNRQLLKLYYDMKEKIFFSNELLLPVLGKGLN